MLSDGKMSPTPGGSIGVTSPNSAVRLTVGVHDIGAGIGQRTSTMIPTAGLIKELDIEYSHEEPTRVESILKKKAVL